MSRAAQQAGSAKDKSCNEQQKVTLLMYLSSLHSKSSACLTEASKHLVVESEKLIRAAKELRKRNIR